MTSLHAQPAVPAEATVADGLPQPQRRWAMLVIILGIMVAVLDGTIVNLALPGIARELQADPAHAIWVVNAYQIATLVMLLPLASLGDLVGYRRVYLVGMALFALASLAATLADSLPVRSEPRSDRSSRPSSVREMYRKVAPVAFAASCQGTMFE